MKTENLFRGSFFVAALTILTALIYSGCTQNQRAFALGGTAHIQLEHGRKFVNASWEGASHLWIATRPTKPEDTVEVYEINEFSSYGLLQGKVIVSETK